MSKKTDIKQMIGDVLNDLDAQGVVRPVEPSMEETLKTMVADALASDGLFKVLRGKHAEMVGMDNSPFRREIDAAKARGRYPRVEIIVSENEVEN